MLPNSKKAITPTDYHGSTLDSILLENRYEEGNYHQFHDDPDHAQESTLLSMSGYSHGQPGNKVTELSQNINRGTKEQVDDNWLDIDYSPCQKKARQSFLDE